jgi:hypothetical protein
MIRGLGRLTTRPKPSRTVTQLCRGTRFLRPRGVRDFADNSKQSPPDSASSQGSSRYSWSNDFQTSRAGHLFLQVALGTLLLTTTIEYMRPHVCLPKANATALEII